MKRLLCLFLWAGCSTWLLPACNDKDDSVMKTPGIEFSPATAYQEAYPGAMVTCKVRMNTAETITRFGIRFKFPGSADFVALPEYPDLSGADAAAFTRFADFQYALPASTDTIDTEMRFRFEVMTGNVSYQKEYVVRMVSAGRQTLRVYNPFQLSYFTFDALDLVRGRGVDATDATFVQDVVATTTEVKVPVNGTSFPAITGWTGANGTTFKAVTAANYNDVVSKYPTIYTAINVNNELTGVSGMLTVTTNKVGVLPAKDAYYIAKVTRPDSVYYIGLTVKKFPLVTAATIGATTALDSLNEYIQFEVKQ